MPLTPAQQQFIRWLKVNEPLLYSIAVERARMEGQTLSSYHTLDSWFDSVISTVTTSLPKVVETVTNIAPQYVQYRQARAQLKQAERGQAPYPVQQAQALATPPEQAKIIYEQAQRAQQNQPPAEIYDYKALFDEPPESVAKRLAPTVAKETKKADMPAWLLPLGIGALVLAGRR